MQLLPILSMIIIQITEKMHFFKLREFNFKSSSHSVVRLSILPSQGSDSGSNPDGSTTVILTAIMDHNH